LASRSRADPGTVITPGCATAVLGASRVWNVGSSVICDPIPENDQLYQSLLAAGFHPVERVDAEAGYVILLERT
jgi:hypothetical protein